MHKESHAATGGASRPFGEAERPSSRSLRPVRLLIDADDVLLNYLKAVLSTYAVVTGIKLDPKTFTEWEYTDKLPFRDDNEKNKFWAAMRSPSFCRSIRPTPGSVDAIKQLREMGADVHVVTTPSMHTPTWVYERMNSLATHFGFGHHQVHFSKAKHLYRGDLFIDDKADNVSEWIEHNPEGVGLLWDTPRNRQNTDLRRIRSWKELLELVQSRRGVVPAR